MGYKALGLRQEAQCAFSGGRLISCSRFRPALALLALAALALVAGAPGPAAPSSPAPWQRPGCHLIGHSRSLSVPGCAEVSATTNACRGFCESWAFPALRPAAPRPVTSLAQCCTIMEAEHMVVPTLCADGARNLTLRSATSCACHHCRKD